jgi:glucose/arabinose dehydrogenase
VGQSRTKSLVFTAIVQLAIIIISCIASYHFTRQHDIIPQSLLKLPEVYVSHSESWDIVKIFALTYLLQIVLCLIAFKSAAHVSSKRFANEYLYYLFAYTTASLYLFLATTINYDPQLVAAFGLFSTALYFVAFVIAHSIFENGGVISSFVGSIKSVLSRLASVAGVIALVYFLSPLIMGKAFVANRDVANVITQVRIWFNPVDASDWGFKNRLPGKVFAQPILVLESPTADGDLYVLERGGKVFRVAESADIDSELILDISANMGEVEIENGAIGMAFHPKYGANQDGNHYIYVYHTDTRPEEIQLNRISRFDVGSKDVSVNLASEEIIFELVRNPTGFHNGGSMEFGSDGFLYIGLGEGTHPKGITLSSEVLRGGILRIDVDMDPERSSPPSQAYNHGIAQGYYVPNDNPFLGNDAIRDEYWALGLRNPFRFNFDPLNGDLWLGDVGSTIWEEVNKIKKGYHYQFPLIEGRNKSGRSSPEKLDIPEQGPVYAYEHNAYDRAVIGGVVSRSDHYPKLKDKYVFADNYSAKLFVMDADKEQVEEVQLIARANQYAQRGISSVTQLKTGEILVTTLGAASEPSGEVLELVKANQANVFREEVKENVLPQDYDEKATAGMFAINCGRCHGVIGDGKGPDSALLPVEIADFTSPLFHASRSAEDIKEIIEKGGTAVGKSPLMPPWGGFLQPEEIEHLVIYIQSLPDKHHTH